MHIAIVSNSVLPFHQSGVSQVIDSMCKVFFEHGHKPVLFTISPNNKSFIEYQDFGYYNAYIVKGELADNYVIESKTFRNIDIQNVFCEFLNEVKPDIVHFHSIHSLGANLVMLAKKKNYITIVTMHDYWWACPHSFLPCFTSEAFDLSLCSDCNIIKNLDGINGRSEYLRDILNCYCDCVICVSEDQRSVLRGFFPGIQLEVIENGVDIESFTETEEINTPLRFGFLGSRFTLKGYDMIMEALKFLPKQSDLFQIYMFGLEASKSERKFNYWVNRLNFILHPKKLMRKISEKVRQINEELHPNIISFPIFCADDKAQLYGQFDVCLVLSQVRESYSMVAHEAVAFGLPLIITNCGGPEHLVREHNCGLIVPKNQPYKLAEAIYLLSKNKTITLDYKRATRNIQIPKAKEQANEYLKQYNELLKLHI